MYVFIVARVIFDVKSQATPWLCWNSCIKHYDWYSCFLQESAPFCWHYTEINLPPPPHLFLSHSPPLSPSLSPSLPAPPPLSPLSHLSLSLSLLPPTIIIIVGAEYPSICICVHQCALKYKYTPNYRVCMQRWSTSITYLEVLLSQVWLKWSIKWHSHLVPLTGRLASTVIKFV